jgi:hypothetical protein
LVSLPDVKEYLAIGQNERRYDHKLLGFIEGIRPQIEKIVGPIFPALFDEKYRGGNDTISLINRPSAGTGCSPVINVLGVSEFRGPIEYPLASVENPVFGSIYSYELDQRMGTITRRTAGGSTIPFPIGANSVHAVYQSSQASIPPNVRLAVLEWVRSNDMIAQMVGAGRQTLADQQDLAPGYMGMPRHVRELLGPAVRGPAFG